MPGTDRTAYHREHPIYGTDFSKPLPEIISKLRDELTRIRGQLGDIKFAFPGWGERTASVEGLLTCGLVSLHYIQEEMREAEKLSETAVAE